MSKKTELTILCPNTRINFRDRNLYRKIKMIAKGDVIGYWDMDGLKRMIPAAVAANALQIFDDYANAVERRDEMPAIVGTIDWDQCEELRKDCGNART